MLDYNEDYEGALKYGIKSFLGRKFKEVHNMFGEGEGADPTKQKPLPGQSTPTQRKQDGTVLGTPAKRPVNGLREYTPQDNVNNIIAKSKQKRLDALREDDEANKDTPGYEEYKKERDYKPTAADRQKEADKYRPMSQDQLADLGYSGKSPTAKFTEKKVLENGNKEQKYKGVFTPKAVEPLKMVDNTSRLLHFQDEKGAKRNIDVSNLSEQKQREVYDKMLQRGGSYAGRTSNVLTANHTGGTQGNTSNLKPQQLHYSGAENLPGMTVNYNNHTQDEIVQHANEMRQKGYGTPNKVHGYAAPAPTAPAPVSVAAPVVPRPRPLAPVDNIPTLTTKPRMAKATLIQPGVIPKK